MRQYKPLKERKSTDELTRCNVSPRGDWLTRTQSPHSGALLANKLLKSSCGTLTCQSMKCCIWSAKECTSKRIWPLDRHARPMIQMKLTKGQFNELAARSFQHCGDEH